MNDNVELPMEAFLDTPASTENFGPFSGFDGSDTSILEPPHNLDGLFNDSKSCSSPSPPLLFRIERDSSDYTLSSFYTDQSLWSTQAISTTPKQSIPSNVIASESYDQQLVQSQEFGPLNLAHDYFDINTERTEKNNMCFEISSGSEQKFSSQEQLITKRSRGRPRIHTERDQVYRRRAQVREAQRTYRQKKDQTIMDLKARVKLLENSMGTMLSVFSEVYNHGMQVASGSDSIQFFKTVSAATARVANITKEVLSHDLIDDDDSSTKIFKHYSVSKGLNQGDGISRLVNFSDSLFRLSVHHFILTLHSEQDEDINRVFLKDIHDKASLLKLLTTYMSSPKQQGESEQVKVMKDEIILGYVTPDGVTDKIKEIECMEGIKLDLDLLISWLKDRGVYKGFMPRFRDIDVNIGIMMARQSTNSASHFKSAEF
ncbi:hypothetical protein V1514DRAFT_318646 [Lipomyces japonicus]|uniref:uncharacterized protein n=1 Tax=Lipomyces japonicus TaxID=56871 RepID=UPI0034CF582D